MGKKIAPNTFYVRHGKRWLDFLLSFVALIGMSPLMLVLAAAVKVKLGSPVIFCQVRPGKDERLFKLYKFRSMADKRDKDGNLLPDRQRLTKFGRLLRSTSLDELPELINILKGDMAIVGPRPLLARYLPYYSEAERHRHDIRPGLTGLAQINGRNYASWDRRLKLDVEYVKKCSFLMDMGILLGTVKKVVRRADVAVDTSAFMMDLDQLRKGSAYGN